ncbi:hypothetical protein HJG54_19935 [Leptolyngbya sp. NK1-12]|uniref:Uncharacterized protein n=1 Tax=Leptolyngbya sp. NK1-12 TaxID=2547451 RepID=A0AA96WNC9_9CYAN|nr:hypothetical protein [Leptolyngbya sp. NK1-12]WNZ24896.1 hypothetical protein HJG54_19935 [Leptolyngbya sp. NK1-12]
MKSSLKPLPVPPSMVASSTTSQFEVVQFQQSVDRAIAQYYGAGPQFATTFRGWQMNLGH